MPWAKFLLIVALASVLASVTDWLFMGALFRAQYMSSPEIWRAAAKTNEPATILYSELIGIVSSAAFTLLCLQANALTLPKSMLAALLVWLAGPVVVLVQMVLWTKLHPLVGASQSIGWLVRFAITAALASCLL